MKSNISNRFLLHTAGCKIKLHRVFHTECTSEVRTHADVGPGNLKNPEINTIPVDMKRIKGTPMVNIDTGLCTISYRKGDLPVHNEMKKGFAMKRSGLYATADLSHSDFYGKPVCAHTSIDAATSYTLAQNSGRPDSLIARATG